MANEPRFSATALIDAPAAQLYAIIADYHEGHPRILPKPPFVDLKVEEGGVGAGTVLRITMRLLGQTQSFRSTVTEPEPGRVLLEANENGYNTSFIVEPQGEQQARVTIETVLGGRSGLVGKLEGWFVRRLLHSAYQRELAKLAEVAQAQVRILA